MRPCSGAFLRILTSAFACSSCSCRAFSLAAAAAASWLALYWASASSSLVACICFSNSPISGSRACRDTFLVVTA